MGILNIEEYKKRLKSGNPVTIEELENELKVLIKEMIETATQEELTSHLGYEKNKKSDIDNYRNGYNKKNLKSKYGEIEVNIPRDRNSTFEPKLVKKRQRLLDGTEDLILSLYAKGMSVKDIQHHLDDLYGYELSTETISNITDRILEKATEWQNRPLEPIYPIIFMDATVLKIKVDRVIKNTACYIMLGINLEGKKDILGIWIAEESETSKYWLSILNEIKNRGVEDVLIFSIDGLNGFNEAIKAVYPKAEIQRCVVHQIRNSLKFVSYKDKKNIAKDLKSIYQADTEELALQNLEYFSKKWSGKYPHIYDSWKRNWDELSTFFKYPKAVRKLIYTTNPIESLNSIIKRKTKQKGSFPSKEAAFKVLFTSTQEVMEKWKSSRIRNWSEIYPQLVIYFQDILVKYL